MSDTLRTDARFQVVENGASAATTDEHTGAMIALKPSDEDIERLAVVGGEDPDQLHVTLYYLGDAADLSPSLRENLVDGCVSLSFHTSPLIVDGFAIAMFNPPGSVQSDGKERDSCVVLQVSGDGLDEIHDAVERIVRDSFAAEIDAPPDQHTPWVPHVTLVYTDDADVTAFYDRTGPITFDRLCVAFGGDYYEIPLGGDVESPNEYAADDTTVLYSSHESGGVEGDEGDAMTYSDGTTAAYFDPGVHPRSPAGDPSGGEFVPAEEKVQQKQQPEKPPRRPSSSVPQPEKPQRSSPNLSYDPRTNRGTGYGEKNGDPRVHRLQEALNRLGLTDAAEKKLALDGKLGPKTTAAVRKAQRSLGLPIDGVVTPELLNRLETRSRARGGVRAVTLAQERDVNIPTGPGHQLRDYWVHGPGAVKIGWGTDGSMRRCIAELGKYVRDPGGLCAEYHHRATGEWPTEHGEAGIPSEGEIIEMDDVELETWAGATQPDADGNCPLGYNKMPNGVCLPTLKKQGITTAVGCPPGHHRMPDGSCMPDAEMPPEPYVASEQTAPWEGVITVEGIESGDGRMFAADSLTWDEPPIPLMWQKETSHGGNTNVSVRVGSVTDVWRVPDPEGRPDVNYIMGRGFVDLENVDGAEVFRRMDNETLSGNSVDVDSVKDADVELVYADVDPTDVADVDTDINAVGDVPENEKIGDNVVRKIFASPELTLYHRGRIRGTTFVEFPAFTEARLALIDSSDGSGGHDASHTFAAVPSHAGATTDTPWDGAAAEKRLPSPMPVGVAKRVYAWLDDSQVQNGMAPKSAGKFPHHDVSADGAPGAANLTACSSGIGILHGGRGGTSIPTADRRGVYDHLAAHLRDARREPPPFTVVDNRLEALTAAAHVMVIPDLPPPEWFDEPVDVTPQGALTITDEGRLYGYLAPLGVRHRSFQYKPVYVPLRNVDYTRFHGGETIVAGGGRVVTGPVTMNCGHLPPIPGYTTDDAQEHYENSCSVVASVRVGSSRSGVWVAGALLPGVTPDQVTRMMTCRLSGDWRPHLDRAGWQELAAALLVPVPGFPLARVAPSVEVSNGHLVAASVPVFFSRGRVIDRPTSGGDSDDAARRVDEAARSAEHARATAVDLLAKSIGRDGQSRRDRQLASRRRWQLAELREKVHGTVVSTTVVDTFTDGFADISIDERRRLAKTGEALPDGSYPIRNVDDLDNAVRSYGRANEADRAKVRAHIMKRARALGRPDMIPENWL